MTFGIAAIWGSFLLLNLYLRVSIRVSVLCRGFALSPVISSLIQTAFQLEATALSSKSSSVVPVDIRSARLKFCNASSSQYVCMPPEREARDLSLLEKATNIIANGDFASSQLVDNLADFRDMQLKACHS